MLYLDGDPWRDDDTIFSGKPGLIVSCSAANGRRSCGRAGPTGRSTASCDFTLGLAG